jgi:hypothetical protein
VCALGKRESSRKHCISGGAARNTSLMPSSAVPFNAVLFCERVCALCRPFPYEIASSGHRHGRLRYDNGALRKESSAREKENQKEVRVVINSSSIKAPECIT